MHVFAMLLPAKWKERLPRRRVGPTSDNRREGAFNIIAIAG